MALVVNSLLPWTATDAGFRAWGQAWSDMMDDLGFTQEYSDIDWATVTMPTTNTTYAGKRVYSFNDDLSSTREVYVSLEWGRGTTATALQGFAIRMTVGTQHTSGTVTGYVMSHYLVCSEAPSDGGDLIGVRTDVGFVIFTNLSAGTSYQAGFGVERLCEDGSPTADGAVMMMSGQAVDTASTYSYSALFRAANYAGGQVFSKAGAQTSINSDLAMSNYQVIPTTSDPSYAGEAPAITLDTFGKYDPCYHWIGVPRALYSGATEFNATINGVASTWRTPYTGFFADNGSTSYSRVLLALRVA